jgi:transcriptional regulator with XRE-family HTH domain
MPRPAKPSKSKAFRSAARQLARILKGLRLERGLSLRLAAERIGVGVAVLRRIEGDRGNPSLAVLLSVARAYGVDVANVLGSLKISSPRPRKQSLRRGRIT